MGQTVAGHPDYPVARHLQFGVALPVFLEGVDTGVVCAAVQLDYDLLVGPGGIDAKTSNGDIELGRLDVAFAAEVSEVGLEPRPRRGSAGTA